MGTHNQTKSGTQGHDGGMYAHPCDAIGTERENAWTGPGEVKAAGEGFPWEMLLRHT